MTTSIKIKKVIEKKEKIKQSETVVIKRSLIKYAPYNPRKHNKNVVEKLKRNFKKVGFLGGISWNEVTGNLIGGHKRLQAMDLIYNYNENTLTSNDYDIKVEKISLSLQEEKEQNVFLNAKDAQGEMDNEMLASLFKEIDITQTGYNVESIEMLQIENPQFEFGNNQQIFEDGKELKKESEEKKDNIKKLKSKIKKSVSDNQAQTHITIVFETYESKAEFLEGIGINGDEILIDSRKFTKQLYET